jgi:N-acetyl-anhydromuramyl-L-alanine amidase AmpD
MRSHRLFAIGVVLLSLAPVHSAAAANVSIDSSMRAAAAARQVPLPLIEAIAYVNTRWEPIDTPALDLGVGPMNILPTQLDQAALFSGHGRAEIVTDPAANLDAGAALLAHFHGSGSDLSSWQPAVASLLGPIVADQVFETLRSGARRTNSLGETIVLASQAIAAPALAAPAGAGQAPSTALSLASTDYPPATWVPANPANYSVADRPHDYPVDMIIIHDTEGSYGSAIQEFQNPAVQASAHYVVSDLGQITQMVLERDIAWHAGNWDYNTRSIGIEHEGYAYQTGWYTTAMYQASAKLSASICSRWGVPMDRLHVIGHSEVPDPNNPGQFGGAGHHTDPGPNWDWVYYMSAAQGYANALPSPPHMVLTATATPDNQSAVVLWQPARSCHSPIDGYTVVGQPGNLTMNLPSSATRTTFTGLRNGISYSFTVTAHNSYGQDSLASNAVTPGPMPFKGLYTLDGYGGITSNASPSLGGGPSWPGWRIARAAHPQPGANAATTGFVLDGWGGLQPYGSPRLSPIGGPYWPNWDIARDFAWLPNGTGGYVLDGWGGLHPFALSGNPLPPIIQGNAYWPGWDIAKKVVIFSDGGGGYVLDGWGGVHGFGIGGVAPVANGTVQNAYWPNWNIARDIVLLPNSHSGYTLDGWGGLHAFAPAGQALPPPITGAYWPSWDIARSLWLVPGSSTAGYTLDGWGGLHPFGTAPQIGSNSYWPGSDIAINLFGA